MQLSFYLPIVQLFNLVSLSNMFTVVDFTGMQVACALCRWCLTHTHTHTHARLTVLCPGPPGWAGTRKVKPIWISLKQEAVSGSGIRWAIFKSALHSRQITMPAPHHSVSYRPDALPAAQPKASKHWRQLLYPELCINFGQVINMIRNEVHASISAVSKSWHANNATSANENGLIQYWLMFS